MNTLSFRNEIFPDYNTVENTHISPIPNIQINPNKFSNAVIIPILPNQSIRRNLSENFSTMKILNQNKFPSPTHFNYSQKSNSSMNSINTNHVSINSNTLNSQRSKIMTRPLSYSGNKYRTIKNYVIPIKHIIPNNQNNNNLSVVNINRNDKENQINQLYINKNNLIYSIKKNIPISRKIITIKKNKRNINKNKSIPRPNYSFIKYTHPNYSYVEVKNYSGNFCEPSEIFNINEYEILKQIGTGSHGQIFCVKWIKNQKLYALKKENLKDQNILKNTIEKNNMLINFFKNTGSHGIIRIYNTFDQKIGNIFVHYELMELAEKDWEQEIKLRNKYSQFYTEIELLTIMKQLIKTLSILQKNNIAHRDIKPQNILISNGFYKICDFGEAKILRNENMISKVRGTELYMSPILLRGLRTIDQIVNHNSYKSDVFSLGMCFLFAATLTMDSLVAIREITDMRIMQIQVLRFLYGRYSNRLINIMLLMLQVEEKYRPSFIQLESQFFS